MLECNAADVQIDAGINLMVNREGCGNSTMYGMRREIYFLSVERIELDRK